MYAYVDARGICHYTNAPGDGRYKLSEREPRRLGSPEDQLIRTITRRSSSGLSRMGLTDNSGYYRGGYSAFRNAPDALNRYIQVAAVNHQVDPLLIKAVIKAESNFDPNAISPKGAQGLMQLMPGTARDMAVNNPFDPLQNINGGAKYLRYLLDNFKGNVELSLGCIQCRPGKCRTLWGHPTYPRNPELCCQGHGDLSCVPQQQVPLPSNINVRQMVTVN